MDIQRSNQAQILQPIPGICDAQTLQTLQFSYSQYMGDHHEMSSLANSTSKSKLNIMPNITKSTHGHTYYLHAQTNT